MTGERAFVTVTIDEAEASVAFGVLDGHRLGIFNMATLPVQRRRGAGRTALTALAAWARDRGADVGYLQVELDNAPALELYRTAGFEHAYRYVYLTG
ncbi:MAG TPA: GNAT family N-acetyltransferase [Solirubrobacteraceae bacterium]|nr:GNAT family N-acetyltransferase [Solirubrobacteraceae bacterium]